MQHDPHALQHTHISRNYPTPRASGGLALTSLGDQEGSHRVQYRFLQVWHLAL